MSTHKSAKELAFLHDLYVATDWGERFAELVDEDVRLTKEGRALYVASGTCGGALAPGGRPGRGVWGWRGRGPRGGRGPPRSFGTRRPRPSRWRRSTSPSPSPPPRWSRPNAC